MASSWLLGATACGDHAGDIWGVEHGLAFLDTLTLLPPNASCSLVDVGAHHGTVARMAAHAGCRVWAFETNKRALAQLRANLNDPLYANSTEIHTAQPVDTVVPRHHVVTMVKIDVDGQDEFVARGAARVLRRALSVHVEIAPRKQGGLKASSATPTFCKPTDSSSTPTGRITSDDTPPIATIATMRDAHLTPKPSSKPTATTQCEPSCAPAEPPPHPSQTTPSPPLSPTPDPPKWTSGAYATSFANTTLMEAVAATRAATGRRRASASPSSRGCATPNWCQPRSTPPRG